MTETAKRMTFFDRLLGWKPLGTQVVKFVPSFEEEVIPASVIDEEFRQEALEVVQEIREQESLVEQLTTIFNAMTQCVYVSDLYDHTVYFTNLKVDDLHGEISGRKCYELFQNNDAPCSFCTNERLLAGERVVEWEFYHPRLKKHFQIMDTIIDWPGVGPARLEVATHITAQKHAEYDARALADACPVAIVFHRNGEVLLLNKAFVELTGYNKEELLADPELIWNMFAPEDRETVKRRVGEKNPKSYNANIITQDGETVPVYVEAFYQPYNSLPEQARVAVLRTHKYITRMATKASEGRDLDA